MSHTKVAIIGSGPTGYTAGIYAGRANLAPILFAGQKSGGQLMLTTEIENFPGFAQGKNGPELMIEMRQQAERFGTTIRDEYVYAVDLSQRPFQLWTQLPAGTESEILEKGTPAQLAALRAALHSQPADVTADAVILAVGARSRMLGVPGENEFIGRGVSTCAVCDAAFYKGKRTIVVGGGDAGMEDTLALTKFADQVTVLVRGDKMRASKIMQDRVLQHPKVTVRFNTNIKEIQGDSKVTAAVLINTQTQATETLPIDGVFIAIGHLPMTQLVADQVQLDDHGFIVTRQSGSAAGVAMAQAALTPEGKVAFPTMTSVEGVFAAGDAVDIRYWQAVTAAGQGCAAAIDAERWLEGR